MTNRNGGLIGDDNRAGILKLSNRNPLLSMLLRAIGLLDLIALIAVVGPRSWIESSHHTLAMGDFPEQPIAGYLARLTSLWYVTFGVLLWHIASDVETYRRLINWVAWVMIAQGIVVVAIDVAERMPVWWIALEGPCCALLGVSILALQRWPVR